jgi:hypothetical protein
MNIGQQGNSKMSVMNCGTSYRIVQHICHMQYLKSGSGKPQEHLGLISLRHSATCPPSPSHDISS